MPCGRSTRPASFTYPGVQTLLDGAFALNKATSDALHAAIATGEALESGHFRGEGEPL